MQRMPTVFVVDDDLGMRKSLCTVFASSSFEVKDFASAEAFLDGYEPERPGCLVLDLRMPGMSGLELQTHLKDDGIDIPVIILTGHGDVRSAVRSFKLGAVDFLEKPVHPRVMLKRAREACSRHAQRHLQRSEVEEIRRRMQRLTDRERQVLGLVTIGKSNKQIAATLLLSAKTVANHRATITSKLQAENAADLARMATLADIYSGDS